MRYYDRCSRWLMDVICSILLVWMYDIVLTLVDWLFILLINRIYLLLESDWLHIALDQDVSNRMSTLGSWADIKNLDPNALRLKKTWGIIIEYPWVDSVVHRGDQVPLSRVETDIGLLNRLIVLQNRPWEGQRTIHVPCTFSV